MIEVKTTKDQIDEKHYVTEWKAIKKSNMISPKPEYIHYFTTDEVQADFYKKYKAYFVDGKFLRKSPAKAKQLGLN